MSGRPRGNTCFGEYALQARMRLDHCRQIEAAVSDDEAVKRGGKFDQIFPHKSVTKKRETRWKGKALRRVGGGHQPVVLMKSRGVKRSQRG